MGGVTYGEATYESRAPELVPYIGYRTSPHIGHKHHLCYLAESGDVTLDQMKELAKNPKYICRKCGRVAANEENICEPVDL